MSINRDRLRNEIREHIMTSPEVREYLNISKVRLYQYVQDGRIEPLIGGRTGIYLKEDIHFFKSNHLDKLSPRQRMTNKTRKENDDE